MASSRTGDKKVTKPSMRQILKALKARSFALIGKTRILLRRVSRAQQWHIQGKLVLSARRFIKFLYYKFRRTLRLDTSFYCPGESSVRIDVFMPTVEKDAPVLPYAIAGLKANVKHPISAIYIVAPKNAKEVRRIAEENGCIFVDEANVLPISKDSIDYVHDGENRGGWVFKMLLNLYADTICNEKNILILDADTVFIRPQIFIYKGKPIFNESPYYHKPYYEANMRLFGLGHPSSMSFITHYMMFNSDALVKLRSAIESYSKAPWYSAIIGSIDTTESSGFADYEIYGDFYRNMLKNPSILNYWLVYDRQIAALGEVKETLATFTDRYGAVALHNYNRGQ